MFCLVDIINHFNSNCTVEPVWKTNKQKNSSKQQNALSTVEMQYTILCVGQMYLELYLKIVKQIEL